MAAPKTNNASVLAENADAIQLPLVGGGCVEG